MTKGCGGARPSDAVGEEKGVAQAGNEVRAARAEQGVLQRYECSLSPLLRTVVLRRIMVDREAVENDVQEVLLTTKAVTAAPPPRVDNVGMPVT